MVYFSIWKENQEANTKEEEINWDTHGKLIVGSHGSERDVADGSATAYRGLREQVRIASGCCLLAAAAGVRVSVLHAFLQIFASLAH